VDEELTLHNSTTVQTRSNKQGAMAASDCGDIGLVAAVRAVPGGWWADGLP
jgi:hypothetical protein